MKQDTLTVTAKGQITLRKDVLKDLGVKAGDKIRLERLTDGSYILRTRQTGKISDVFDLLKRPGQRPISIEEMNEAIADSWAGNRDPWR